MNNDNVIILRSVYKLPKHTFQPCINPRTGRYPDCIKKTDSNGDMILSEKDKESGKYFIKDIDEIIIVDGTTFDLNNPIQKATWEAIEHSSRIAKDRDERDEQGNLIIDGNQKKYGNADLYVERPGSKSTEKLDKKQKIHKAQGFIYNDSSEHRKTVAKLLGKAMYNVPDPDIQYYLIEESEKRPDKIIQLYTGNDFELFILLEDAIEKHIIWTSGQIYMYADGVKMGASKDAVIEWFKKPEHRMIFEEIQRYTYPEYYSADLVGNSTYQSTGTVTTIKPPVSEIDPEDNSIKDKKVKK